MIVRMHVVTLVLLLVSQAALAECDLAGDDFLANAAAGTTKPEKETKIPRFEISARVISVEKRTGGDLIIALDNGQTWIAEKVGHQFLIKVGDPVAVRKNEVLGGYQMITQDDKSNQVRQLDPE